VHRRAAEEAGHAPLPLSINSHLYVADTSEQAADEFFPHYAGMMNRIGRERGWSGLTREGYAQLRSLRGALVVGSVDEVVEKILYQQELFGHTRFLAQTSLGTLPHEQALRSIELFGREVAPRVRAAVAAREAQAETSR
jgi:alkanesulfonate monooxygenase SsuD/methylene tetrahydromethanopterin reductase-like flavin-dependent oxidoreductase (luciferase family)